VDKRVLPTGKVNFILKSVKFAQPIELYIAILCIKFNLPYFKLNSWTIVLSNIYCDSKATKL